MHSGVFRHVFRAELYQEMVFCSLIWLTRRTGLQVHNLQRLCMHIWPLSLLLKNSDSTYLLRHLMPQIQQNATVSEEDWRDSRVRLRCLNDMFDHTEIFSRNPSPGLCSALLFILLTSGKELDVFDFSKYSATEKAVLKVLPKKAK